MELPMNELDETRGFLRTKVIESFQSQIQDEFNALIDDVVGKKAPDIIYCRDLGNNACIFNHHDFAYRSETLLFDWLDPFFSEQKILLGHSYTYQTFDFDYSDGCSQYVFAGKDAYFSRHPFKATGTLNSPLKNQKDTILRDLAMNYWEEYKFFFESYLYAKFLIANKLVANLSPDKIVAQFGILICSDLTQQSTRINLATLKTKAYKGYEKLKASGQKIKFENDPNIVPIIHYGETYGETYVFKPEEEFPIRVNPNIFCRESYKVGGSLKDT